MQCMRCIKEVCISLWRASHSLSHPCLGIMHGDLKPQNILVLERGGFRIKLCDFDSSRDVGESEDFPNNGTCLKFSREYVCPEVFHCRNIVTGSRVLRASLEIDLFALGLICALLLDSRLSTISALLPVELSDELLEKYLFDQAYLKSILQCDDGYLAYLLTFFHAYLLTY